MNTKPILILVDFQNGFLTEEMKPTADRIMTLLESDTFSVVVSTSYVNKVGSPCATIGQWHEMYKNDVHGISLIGNAYEFVNTHEYKSTYTAITPDIKEYLLMKKVDSVFVAGFNTDCCVLKTALDLFDLNIRPIVLEKYCDSSMGLQTHNMAIEILKPVIGEHNVYEHELDFDVSQTLLDLTIPELRVYKIGIPIMTLTEPATHKIVGIMDNLTLSIEEIQGDVTATVLGIYQSYLTINTTPTEDYPTQFNVRLDHITHIDGIEVNTRTNSNILYDYIVNTNPHQI